MPDTSSSSSTQPRAVAVAVVLSAGQGTRMGASQNKVFLPLAGKPLLVHTVEAFARSELVREVLLVAHPDEVAYCEREMVAAFALRNVRAVVAGGVTRHQSEVRALAALRDEIAAGRVDVVLIHDGARPLLDPTDIDRLVVAARRHGGALLATPVAADEVIAVVDASGAVQAPAEGAALWRAQTPQAFDARELLRAYDQAAADAFEGTDTASSYERLGHQVRIVAGHETNFKVTTPHDLLRAEYVLREGQDDHGWRAGR